MNSSQIAFNILPNKSYQQFLVSQISVHDFLIGSVTQFVPNPEAWTDPNKYSESTYLRTLDKLLYETKSWQYLPVPPNLANSCTFYYDCVSLIN